mgnify:CR=1 FL=1
MVLGSVMLQENLIKDLVDEVSEEDFFHKGHKIIYKAMIYLHYNHQEITYTTVIDRIKYTNPEEEKLFEYVLELSDAVASMVNFQSYVNKLIDLSQKRKLYHLGKSFTNRDISGVSIEELMEDTEQTIDSMKITSNIEVSSVKDYVKEWYENFQNTEEVQSLLFGFRELDNKVMFEKGNLGIIGARPGVGKSALALNYALNFAMQGYSVLFVTLEMSEKEVLNRLAAHLAKVEHTKIIHKTPLSDSEKKRMAEAVEKIKRLDINIFYKGDMTPQHLINLSKKLKKNGGCDAVIVDYIQLMDSGKKNLSAVQDVTFISRKLKQLAQELEIQVLALSQLSRKLIGQDGKPREPQLSDLRESGAIEQDANFVMMLHSNDVDNKFEKHKFIDLFIRKNRSGTMGKVSYTYYGDFLEFEEKKFNPDINDYEVVTQLDLENDVNDSDLPF